MNLLVVDDEYYIVHSIVTNLDRSALGIDQVFSAYSIDQAKRVILTQPVDVMLTDIEMPHGGGLELIEWTKAQGYSILPLILSGHQRFDYAQQAITMQCFRYILKPVRITELEKALSAAIASLSETALAPGVASVSETVDENEDFVEKVRAYIHANLAEQSFSRSTLADYLHMNPDYFSYLFHSKFGKTFSDYLNIARIDRAKELLQGSALSMQEVSLRAGFSSYSNFFKQFKKTTGTTPQHFRAHPQRHDWGDS